MHRLPYRATFYLLTKHEHTQCLHVFVRLTVGSSRVYGVDYTCSTTYGSLNNFLISVLLTLYLHIRIQSGSAKPEVGIIAFVGRLLVDMYTWYVL